MNDSRQTFTDGPLMLLPRVLTALSLVTLACAADSAQANLAPDGDKPDFALTSIAFKGKTTTKQDFPISTSAAAAATLKLGATAKAGMQEQVCEYQMTFDAVNAGPGSYAAPNPHDGVVVAVSAKFPDGTTQNFEGNWFCEGAFTQGIDDSAEEYESYSQGVAPTSGQAGGLSKYRLAPGVGCATTEPIILAVGKTRIAWTFDPGGEVAEFSEGNNKFVVDLVVGANCEPWFASVKPGSAASTSAMNAPAGNPEPVSPTPVNADAARAASSSSRESFGKAFRFGGGNAKVIRRPVPTKKPRSGRDP